MYMYLKVLLTVSSMQQNSGSEESVLKTFGDSDFCKTHNRVPVELKLTDITSQRKAEKQRKEEEVVLYVNTLKTIITQLSY